MTQPPPPNGRDDPARGAGRLDRMPPQAVEVEQAVLGAMLIDVRAVGRAVELLDEEAFYHGPHGRIFAAMVSLYERNAAVDQLTVGEELKRRGQLDAAGGVVYLAELAGGVASAANIEHHARIVVERGLSRGLIEASAEISNRAYEGRSEVYELIDWAEQRIFSLSEKRLSQGFEPIESVLHETFEHIERAHNRTSAVSGVDTGFRELNDITSGFQPGDLVIMAARPSVGKTALALSFSCRAAVEHGVGVAVFSLEMSKQQVAQRLLCIETRVDLHKLRTGRLSEEDWLHLTRNVGRLAQAPIYVDDTPGITVLEARAKARRLQREHGVSLVIVDYLQLMGTHENTQSREQEVSRISRGLKALAKELDVPVLALSQLSRAPEARTDRRPQLSDLRESGCLTASTRIRRADDGAESTIGSLAESGERNIPVWTLDRNWKLVCGTMSHAFPSGRKPVYRLRLASGRQVEATSNHPFRTLDGWARLDALEVGSCIAVPRSLPDPDTVSARPEAEVVMLAHLLGDGCVLARQPIHYTSGDPENLDAVEKAASHWGITPRRVRQERWWHTYLPSFHPLARGRHNPIQAWWRGLGLYNRHSWEKFIPGSVFSLPTDQIRLFLRHLWATDGHLSVRSLKGRQTVHAYYATTSRRLAADVQSLLTRLGIQGRISSARTSGHRDSYHVVLSGKPDLRTFVEEVGVHGRRGEKAADLMTILDEKIANPNTDTIPFEVREEIVAALKRGGITHRQLAAELDEQYCGSYLLGSTRRPRTSSRERLARTARILRDKDLMNIAESDVLWDEVGAIEPLGEQPVFDASVPGTHNFLANDIVVHNSLEQDSDVVLFIYRPDMYGLKSPDGTSLEGVAEIIIGKQRNGPTGSVHLMWNADSASFENLAPEFRIQQEEDGEFP